jgi:hypothetical protein
MSAAQREQNASASSSLLDSMQALIKVERDLTDALEQAEPWLSSSTNTPVRPLPSSMAQVEQVLALARSLSARTSAPAGWNPQAPVTGFATPNPLPHQLRGGALGTLQLERARAAKRQRQEQERTAAEQKSKQQKQQPPEPVKMDIEPETVVEETKEDIAEEAQEARDPKRREVVEHEHELDRRTQSDISLSIHISQQKQPPKQQVLTADMNLSDSSRDEESD